MTSPVTSDDATKAYVRDQLDAELSAARFRYANEQLDNLCLCLFGDQGVEAIPEREIAQRFFEERADAELECLRKALARRAKR